MDFFADKLESILRKDIDRNASVRPIAPQLSAYLSSSYNLCEANVLGLVMIVAEPNERNLSLKTLVKRTAALAKALKVGAVLYLPTLSSPQRRMLLEEGQAFITREGDYFLPQLALSFGKTSDAVLEERRLFAPTQQLVFLYCLYADKEVIEQSEVAAALNISAGSVSAALSLFVKLNLIDYVIGGATGRKKSYYVRDKRALYENGIVLFGSPVRRILDAPVALADESWLKSGLSALADESDLVPPERPVFALSSVQAKDLCGASGDSMERCIVQVLKYDPVVFSKDGRVDPLTMLLTIDEQDERISLAVQQALRGCEWYRA